MTMTPWIGAAGSHVLESTLVAAAIYALVKTLFRSAGPSVRYWLWFTASVKFLVPFAVLAAVGQRFAWVRVPPAVRQSVDVTVDRISALSTPLSPSSWLTVVPDPPVSPFPWLAALWVCGAAIATARLLKRWRDVHVAKMASTPLGVYQGIPVRSLPASCDPGWVPGVIGLTRPIVLVPDGIHGRLTAEQFTSVLEHESCHVRRRDNLTATIHNLVEVLFWYHPGVWWIGHRLQEEREHACDESVVSRGTDPAVYAESLLTLCRHYVESPVMATPVITRATLTRRIENILSPQVVRRQSRTQQTLLTGLAVALVAVPLLLGLNAAPANAQMAAAFRGLMTSATRRFDVASVKLNTSGNQGWRLGAPRNGTESIVNLELRKIIASSFRIQDKMVIGGPSWLDSERYDIEGRGDPNIADVDVWDMMRSLLAERFQLTYRIEEREMGVYVMSLAAGGHRLGDPAQGRCADAIKAGTECGAIRFPPFGVAIDNMPIGALTAVLARSLQDRPVVDNTGLTALYDTTVRWMPFDMTPEQRAAIPDDVRPPDMSLFDAFDRQAGLKLEARRQRIDVLVIDSIQRPEPN